MLNVCVPVRNRYDLLHDLLVSLTKSERQPDTVYVIDNGCGGQDLLNALEGCGLAPYIWRPKRPLGVAESWNWFLHHVPDDRIITNDDITFAPGSLGAMQDMPESFVTCGEGFSCFLLRDACVSLVGEFDEDISPGYAYFEDMDYLRRLRLAGVQDGVVQCGVFHHRSATPKKFTQEEQDEHHKRFSLAEENYRTKWEQGPSWEQLRCIGGAGANQ